MTKIEILGAVSSIALSLATAGTASAQSGGTHLASPAPSGRTAQLNAAPAPAASRTDVPSEILVDMSGSVGGYPLPATPYESRGLRTTSLADWQLAYGAGEESMREYHARAEATRENCTEAGSAARELIEIVRPLAQLDPMFADLFTRYDVNLAERQRTANRVGRGANFIQGLLGLLEVIRNPETMLSYGVSLMGGAANSEAQRWASQYAQELSREANMLSLLFQRLGLRHSLWNGRQSQHWLKTVYPTCVGIYPEMDDISQIPLLAIDSSITDPIRNGISRP